MELRLFQVTYTPEAEIDLRELHAYITLRATRRTATEYLQRLREFCQGLAIAPHRGERRVYRPGLRSIGFEHRITVLFAILEEQRMVEINGFDYAGRQREW